MGYWCNCGSVKIAPTAEKFRSSVTNILHGRNECVGYDEQVRRARVGGNPLPAGIVSDVSDAEKREHDSYRARWNAGARKAQAEIDALKARLHQQIDANKHLMTGKPQQVADYIASVVPTPDQRRALMNHSAPVAPIDLARLRHESAVSSDRAATQAHIDRARWDEGLDPDDV